MSNFINNLHNIILVEATCKFMPMGKTKYRVHVMYAIIDAIA